MALNGESIWWRGNANSSNTPKTFTWTVDFAAQSALAKVWTSMYIAGIQSIVRESSTAIQVVQANNDPAIGDGDMSSVTFGLYLYKCQVTIVLNVDFFD
jgi:hypothetical protein